MRWIVQEGALTEADEEEWRRANARDFPYLPFHPDAFSLPVPYHGGEWSSRTIIRSDTKARPSAVTACSYCRSRLTGDRCQSCGAPSAG